MEARSPFNNASHRSRSLDNNAARKGVAIASIAYVSRSLRRRFLFYEDALPKSESSKLDSSSSLSFSSSSWPPWLMMPPVPGADMDTTARLVPQRTRDNSVTSTSDVSNLRARARTGEGGGGRSGK